MGNKLNIKYKFKINEHMALLIKDAKERGGVLYNKYYNLFFNPVFLEAMLPTGAFRFAGYQWEICNIEDAIDYFDKKIEKALKDKKQFLDSLYKKDDINHSDCDDGGCKLDLVNVIYDDFHY